MLLTKKLWTQACSVRVVHFKGKAGGADSDYRISTEVHVDIDSEAKRDFFHHSTTSSGPSINVELAHIPKKEEQV